MAEEKKQEYSEEQLVVAKEMEKRFDSILNMLGLESPIDYIFLDFALQKSRLNLKNISDSLHFLFHTVSNQDLKNLERPFPHSIFAEKCETRIFDEKQQGTVESSEIVLWSLVPSEQWKTRDILPFTDFHLYFMDIVKPLYGYSAEDLYRLLDEKKGDLFFVTHGTRSTTESKRIVTLFVTAKHIIAFHFDPVDVTTVPQTEKFKSKWISIDSAISIQSLSEFAVFARPEGNLVLKDVDESDLGMIVDFEPTKKVNFATPGLDYVGGEDCLNCSA